jgi:hypothetical protein
MNDAAFSENVYAGAIASWTAAALCRFRFRHSKKSTSRRRAGAALWRAAKAEGLAHSKTSRQFGRFMDRNMSLK